VIRDHWVNVGMRTLLALASASFDTSCELASVSVPPTIESRPTLHLEPTVSDAVLVTSTLVRVPEEEEEFAIRFDALGSFHLARSAE
jgi:hypothetical protein